MSLRVLPDSVVTLAYTLMAENGDELEERTPENPFSYIQGRGHILPKVERALLGQTPGFATTVRVDVADAYGRFRSELVVEMPRKNFPSDLELKLGMKFDTTGPDGQPLAVRVVAVDRATVTVDGNHPLAGIGLIFELRLLDVREPSPEERKTGTPVPSRRTGLH